MNGRTKNGVRNIAAAVVNRLILTLMPFVVRTVIVKFLGSDYLGLNGLFTSVLVVLNLAELGFGSALVYSMYKPIAENDEDKICALLSLYKKIYIYIGIVILSVGSILTPFLPKLIKSDVPPDVNLYILYFIYLFNTAGSYFVFADRRALLIAHQRSDITSNINTIISVILYTTQIVVLIAFKNYYVYIIALPVFTILENIFVGFRSKKDYGHLICKGEISKDEKKKIGTHIKGLAIQNFCSASRNAFDSIVISMYFGLTSIAIYNNYYYIMNAVHAFLYQIPNSIRATVGNSIAGETINKNFRDFNVMTLIYQWGSGWCLCCLLCLYQPFMKLWMGEPLMASFSTIVLLCLYFFELCMSDIIVLYKDGAGLWWHGRYRTIIEAITNLILNFVLGKYFGINGIIFATIITLTLIGHGYGGYIVFHYYFKTESYGKYVLLQLFYLACATSASGLTYFVCTCIQVDGIAELFIRFIICLIVPNVIYYLVFRTSKYYRESLSFIKNIRNTITHRN